MITIFNKKLIIAALFCSATGNLLAEGILEFKPSIGVDTTYDDNIYRFSTPEQAKAVFGTSSTSDTIVRTELGLDVDLRLSRQLISLTSNISKSEYNRFDQLNNVGKSFGLAWDWQLGNQFFGQIGASESEAFSGFDELRNASGNIRVAKRKFANANWRLHPSWTASVNASTSSSDNSLGIYSFLNNESNAIQAGIQYRNLRGTQLSLAYRNSVLNYKDNVGDRLVLFGDESTTNELIVNATWEPTTKIRLSTRLSQINLDYNNANFTSILPQRSFSGLNKRVIIDYLASAKTNINFNIYNEIFAVEELSSTFVKSKGFSINPSWRPTDKLSFTASWGTNERDFLGDSGISTITSLVFIDRFDKTKSTSMSMVYLPTQKSLVRLTYSGADRTSSLDRENYEFNMVNLAFKYFF